MVPMGERCGNGERTISRYPPAKVANPAAMCDQRARREMSRTGANRGAVGANIQGVMYPPSGAHNEGGGAGNGCRR